MARFEFYVPYDMTKIGDGAGDGAFNDDLELTYADDRVVIFEDFAGFQYEAWGHDLDSNDGEVNELYGYYFGDQMFGIAGQHLDLDDLTAPPSKILGILTRGSDRITGSDFNDVLAAGRGDDVAAGGRGRDKVYGNSGDDRLNGNSGQDYLLGNSGEDRLKGGKSNDTLRGGDDHDTFVFADDGSSDRIVDFERGDLIEITSGARRYSSLDFDREDGDVEISFGDDTTFLVHDVRLGQLHEDAFLFS